MEHRHFNRVDIALKVKLYRNHRLLGEFRTQNISLEGIFLATGDIDLVRNDIVQLRLYLSNEAYLIRGFVIHAGNSGVGIMMIDDTFFKLIREQRPSIRDLLSRTGSDGPGLNRIV